MAQRYQNGVDMAQAFRDMARNHLAESRGVATTADDFRRYAQFGGPNINDPLGMSSYKQPGTVNGQYGMAPTESEVDQLIKMAGGNPYTGGGGKTRKGGLSSGSKNRGRAGDTGDQAPQSMLEQLAADFKSKINEANAANLARYNEGHGELSSLRDRNQGRVDNWGKSAEADLQERMQEAMGNVSADLASRGLANSNIMPAFKERNARDTAREMQRISEMRDARASEYDTRDTANLVGFVERRNDIAPDYGQLISIADRMGQAEALKAFQQQQNQNGSQGYNYEPQGYGGIPVYGAAPGAIRGIGQVDLFGGAMNSLPQFRPAPTYQQHDYSYRDQARAARQSMSNVARGVGAGAMAGAAMAAGAGPFGAILPYAMG